MNIFTDRDKDKQSCELSIRLLLHYLNLHSIDKYKQTTANRCAELKAAYPDMPIDTQTPFAYFFADYEKGCTFINTLSGFVKLQNIASADLPKGMVIGVQFDVTSFDTPRYLQWLLARFTKRQGKTCRMKLMDIREAASVTDKPVDVVVNCCGAGAKELRNVEDKSMEPETGHNVVIAAPWLKLAAVYNCHEPDQMDLVHRPGGNVALTNKRLEKQGYVRCQELWIVLTEKQPRLPDIELSRQTIAFAVETDRRLLPPGRHLSDLRIVSSGWGRRPNRTLGIRLETETTSPGKYLDSD